MFERSCVCGSSWGQQKPAVEGQAVVAAGSLDAAIEQSHRALGAILNGNPKLYEELFAGGDDVTLGNPFGPFARGRAAIVKTLAGAAAKYRDGTVISVDLVAKYLDDNIACVVEVENDRGKVGSSDTLADFHVRTTSV
jgi:hypothetical protein